ncbi:MAG: helix-turn-helix domain-containing protein [Alicyclobacillus sp.]|nr:helix-turn-helix domain-containing protein [Alicyclobacillus sp.]
MDAKFYTPQEVAQILRLNVNTIYEYIRMGKLPAARFGNRYRITEQDVQQFVEYQKSLVQEGQ